MKIFAILPALFFFANALAVEPTLIKEIVSSTEMNPFDSGLTLDKKHAYNYSDVSQKLHIFNLETGKEILSIELRKTDECRPTDKPRISNQTFIDKDSNLAMIGNCCLQYPNKQSCVYKMIDLTNSKLISEIDLNLNNAKNITYDPKGKKLRFEYISNFREFDFLNNSYKEFKFNYGEILLIDQSSQIILSSPKNSNITEIYDFPARKKLGELATDFDNYNVNLKSYRKIANRFLVFPFTDDKGGIHKIEIRDLVTGKSIVEEGFFSYIQSGEDDFVIKRYSKESGLFTLERFEIQTGIFKEIYKSKRLSYYDVDLGVMSLQDNEEKLYFTRSQGWNASGLAGSLSLKTDEIKYSHIDCMPDSFSKLVPSFDGEYFLCANEKKTAWWKVW